MSNKTKVSDSSVFEDTIFTKEERIKQGSTQTVEWKFKEGFDHSKIKKVKPQCGCTANVTIFPDKVVAEYKDDTNVGNKEYKTTSKALTVHFRDGKDEVIKNERGVVVPNPNKKKEILFFVFSVEK